MRIALKRLSNCVIERGWLVDHWRPIHTMKMRLSIDDFRIFSFAVKSIIETVTIKHDFIQM